MITLCTVPEIYGAWQMDGQMDKQKKWHMEVVDAPPRYNKRQTWLLHLSLYIFFFYKQSIFDPCPEQGLNFFKKSPQKIV